MSIIGIKLCILYYKGESYDGDEHVGFASANGKEQLIKQISELFDAMVEHSIEKDKKG